MKRVVIAVAMPLIFYNTLTAQVNKSCADSCGKGIYWIEGNSEKVSKDSIAITGYIKIVSGEMLPPAPFSAIYFNEKKVLADGNGKVYIRLQKGEYQICAFSGGAYSLSASKMFIPGGSGVTITFYLKAQDLTD